jgi:hypothetical protein
VSEYKAAAERTDEAERGLIPPFKHVPEKNWLIWSVEHERWWAPDHDGYVANRVLAGRYSYQEAREIVADANRGKHDIPDEAMCPDWEAVPSGSLLT